MKRYSGLDVLKLILAFFVICIHVSHSWWGFYQNMFYRTAVPCFFMITGYFYPYIIAKNSQNKQIKKILFITIVSILLYIIYSAVSGLVFYGNISAVFVNAKLDIVKLLFFNITPIGGHLWYLLALLYTLLIVKFIKKETLDGKLTYVVIAVCLALSLIFGKYCIPFFNNDISGLGYNTNFITLGIPFFLIGYKLNQFTECHENFKLKESLIFFIIALIISCIEVYFYYHPNNCTVAGDIFITTPLLSAGMFLSFLNLNFENKIWLFISRLGKIYSVWIYVLHMMIYDIINKVQAIIKIYIPYYNIVAPFFIFGLTLVISIIINNIWIRIKPHKAR